MSTLCKAGLIKCCFEKTQVIRKIRQLFIGMFDCPKQSLKDKKILKELNNIILELRYCGSDYEGVAY